MRIPADALIPAEKLTGYLLVPRPWDDKAKLLALELAVTAVWFRQHTDGRVRFVTLKPRRERRP